jgi:hypothetical protein
MIGTDGESLLSISMNTVSLALYPGASGWESNPSADKDKGSDGGLGGKRRGRSGWKVLEVKPLTKLERMHGEKAKARHKDSIGMPKVGPESICTDEITERDIQI